MRRILPFLTLAFLVTACKSPPQETSQTTQTTTATTTAPTPAAAPRLSGDAQRAQTVLNQTNQGRACTTLTKDKLETVIDKNNPEFAKRQVLIKHGVVEMTRASGGNGTLDWQVYKNAELNEADGKGVFIAEGPVTYYCFGRWQVKDAQKSEKFAVGEGQQLLIATVELVDAVPWVKEDPEAQALAAPSISNDPAYLAALDQYDKPMPPSYTAPNQVAVAVTKQ